MAGNNAIQILRGSRANIINKNQQYKLEEGQLLYNKDDNYLTIGKSSNSNLTSPPIVTREIVGHTHEDSGDPISAAPTIDDALKKYSITYKSGSGLKLHNPVVVNNGDTTTDYKSSTMNGIQAFAIGRECEANGNQSFAGGYKSTSNGDYSFSFGDNVTAGGSCFAIGKYNDSLATDIFQVGAGSSQAYKNALRVDEKGWLYAPINKNSIDITDSNLDSIGRDEQIPTFYHIQQVSNILNERIGTLRGDVDRDYIKKSSVVVKKNNTDGTVNIEIITT